MPECAQCKDEWAINKFSLVLINPKGGYGREELWMCIYCLKKNQSLHERAIEVCGVEKEELF